MAEDRNKKYIDIVRKRLDGEGLTLNRYKSDFNRGEHSIGIKIAEPMFNRLEVHAIFTDVETYARSEQTRIFFYCS